MVVFQILECISCTSASGFMHSSALGMFITDSGRIEGVSRSTNRDAFGVHFGNLLDTYPEAWNAIFEPSES